MDKNKVIQKLLEGSASDAEIELLKRMLASGEISIGGNVNQSVVIIGDGNTVGLPLSALDRLGVRSLLGDLERDLTTEEIATGLRRLDKLMPNRAPVLLPDYKDQSRRLRAGLKTESKSLSPTARGERIKTLAAINSICLETVDISFNSLCLGEEAPQYESRCPFRGLESFRVEDHEFFFGREELTQNLVGKIKAHSFLAVLGASGSGKSSLVMAGVIPALDLDYAIIRPGIRPLDALDSVHGKPLIVVDQFEELFTLTRDEKTRADFISALLAPTMSSRVIITMRSDFLGEAGAYRSLSGEIQNHLEIIPPMNTDELRRAMEGQARWARLEFEADLSQQILDDVEDEPGAMPLLQHTLWELWNRRHGRHLRANQYRAFGGVRQAITTTAEKVFSECSKAEQEQLRDIFLRLTRLDEEDEGRDTRRRVPLDDLLHSGADAVSLSALLDDLASARLIVKTASDQGVDIEVAHEALIRHWERLQAWLNADRNNLRLRESVGESAREWDRSGRHESLLNSRWVRLDEALLLTKDARYRLTGIEQAYLKACVTLRNREQRERERRLRWTVFASVAAMVVFLILAGYGWLKSREAADQANIALARQLAAQANLLNRDRGSNQMVASLLAIQSMNLFPTGEGARFLVNDNHSVSPISFMNHDDLVYSIVFSPDGKYVASAGRDGTARVWDVDGGGEIFRITHDNAVAVVIFSPDGRYVASGGIDHAIHIWDVSDGNELARMTLDGAVTSIDFSPNGMLLVSGGDDHTVRIWDVKTGRELSRMTHDDTAYSVDFSPDGNHVVSGGDDFTVRVWDASDGTELARMTHEGQLSTVAFSPDGRYIVSGSLDHTARVWETATGTEIARMTYFSAVTSAAFSPDGKYVVSASMDRTANVWVAMSGGEVSRILHDTPVTSLAFSPDGEYVISGSWDHTARVWKAASGEEFAHITHEDRVYAVAFSPDGRYVASAGADHMARVWEAGNKQKLSRMIYTGAIFAIDFSSDGSYVVIGSEDHTARVWRTSTREEIVRLVHGDEVTSVAFSPDDAYVVSGSADNTVRVWDAFTGRELARMTHDGSVTSAAFSPDGKYVVTGSEDRTVRVWEAFTGRELARMHFGGIVSVVAFSPDGEKVGAGGYDQAVHVWEAMSGREVARLPHDGSRVTSIAFSPDGKHLVSGGTDGTARVWDVQSGGELSRMVHEQRVSSVAFGPDGESVVSGSWDRTARVWRLDGSEVSRMNHDDEVNTVNFSPDGRYVVSGSADHTARVWQVLDGEEVARMTHTDHVITAVFSPDGETVISGGWDDIARLWRFLPDDLIHAACSDALRNLTRVEWNALIGDVLPYQAVCPNLPIEP